MSSVRDQALDHVRGELSKEAGKAPLGKRIKRGVILGGAGLATAAAVTGAASAGKEEALKPMAPPRQQPPGY